LKVNSRDGDIRNTPWNYQR